MRDIWHKYHSWYFEIASNFTRLMALEFTYNNFEISLVVFMPNITTNHAISYIGRRSIFFKINFWKLVSSFSRLAKIMSNSVDMIRVENTLTTRTTRQVESTRQTCIWLVHSRVRVTLTHSLMRYICPLDTCRVDTTCLAHALAV